MKDSLDDVCDRLQENLGLLDEAIKELKEALINAQEALGMSVAEIERAIEQISRLGAECLMAQVIEHSLEYELKKISLEDYEICPEQAVENLKFHVSELRNLYFTMLQLPDWSYEKMSQVALSGESRKQLFIDAQLKVNDEKGPLIEFFDREVNVIKAYAKIVFGDSYAADIDALKAEIIVTPFTISDEKDDINNLMTANGGKPLMSQRESIERYGQSDDVDKTLQEIKEEEALDSFNMTE